jgi:hypothetical protein
MSLSSSYSMKALHTQEVRNIYIQRWERKGMSASATLRQRLQQCLGFLEVCGVKPLGEPAVDRGQQLIRLGPLALLLP